MVRRQYRQGPDGKMAGSVGGPGEHVPTANPVSSTGDETLQLELGEHPTRLGRDGAGAGEMLTLGRQSASLQTEAAKGSDAPPLAVKTSSGERLYVLDPADAEWVSEHPDEALATGRAFPSITTCMGVLDKPALMPWASGQAAEYGTNRLREISADLDDDDVDAAKEKLDEWLTPLRDGRATIQKEMAGAYRQRRDSAADRGTDVHAIVEDLVRGGDPEVPEHLEGYVRGYYKFREDFPDIEYAATEITVFNQEHGYAGTADALVKIDGKYYVLDYKTNKNGAVYESVGLQLAAIAKANQVVHPDGQRTEMPPIAGGIGVGLGPNGKYSVVPFKTDRHFDAFAASVRVWRVNREVKKHKQVKARSISDIVDNV